jgi:hypothetical protein
MKAVRAIVGLATVSFIAWTPLVAQQPQGRPTARSSSEPFRVVGRVVGRDDVPVADAEVIAQIENDSVPRFARSDVAGRFQIDDVRGSAITLRVRRLGFQPQLLSVQVTKAGRTANVTVTLEPSVTSLDPVVVADDSVAEPPNPRLVGFNERLATNSFGHYVTPEVLARKKPNHASEVLRELPGVITRPARFGSLVRLRGCGVRGQSSEKVGPLVWLDGVRLVGAEIDEITQATEIAAIEVYNSFAGVPAQYLDRSAVCGTILVWTKTR